MSKIEREKRIVRQMIALYCRRHLKATTMPEEYRRLTAYAERRLDHCRFGERKKACKNCPIHCYAPREREQIRQIMRWSGPRMIFHSPLAALLHLLGR